MASLNQYDRVCVTLEPVGNMLDTISTSIDCRIHKVRRNSAFKPQGSSHQQFPQQKLEMVKRKHSPYLLSKKLTINKRDKIFAKQGKRSEQSFSLLDMPQAPHNTTQYILECELNGDHSMNESYIWPRFDEAADHHDMLGSMRGIFPLNDPKDSCLFKDFREQALNVDVTDENEMRDEAEVEIRRNSYDSNQEEIVNSLEDLEQYQKEENFDVSRLIERVRSNPIEAEEIIKNLVTQVRIRDRIIQDLRVKQH